MVVFLPIIWSSSPAEEVSGIIRHFENDKTPDFTEWVDKIAAAGDFHPGPVIQAIASPQAGSRLQGSSPLILRRMYERRHLGVGEPETGITFSLYIETDEEQVSNCHPVVMEVKEESPGNKAGLQRGDVIVSWNGKAMEGPESVMELHTLIRKAGKGATVQLGVRRFAPDRPPHLGGEGNHEVLSFTLGALRAKPLFMGNSARYAGWLHRMHHEHGLPLHMAVPQP